MNSEFGYAKVSKKKAKASLLLSICTFLSIFYMETQMEKFGN